MPSVLTVIFATLLLTGAIGQEDEDNERSDSFWDDVAEDDEPNSISDEDEQFLNQDDDDLTMDATVAFEAPSTRRESRSAAAFEEPMPSAPFDMSDITERDAFLMRPLPAGFRLQPQPWSAVRPRLQDAELVDSVRGPVRLFFIQRRDSNAILEVSRRGRRLMSMREFDQDNYRPIGFDF